MHSVCLWLQTAGMMHVVKGAAAGVKAGKVRACCIAYTLKAPVNVIC